jgi:hypothetical protein
MIRLGTLTLVLFFTLGLIFGIIFFRKTTKDPIDYEDLYSTVSGGYLSDDVNMLELSLLCNKIKKRAPNIVAGFIKGLQSKEILLNVPNGGTFIVIDYHESKLFPEHTLLKLKGVDSDTTFWVRLSSVRKIETKEDIQ